MRAYDFRFTPESGLRSDNARCPLRANRRHRMANKSAFDYVSRLSSFRYCATFVRAAECSKFCAVSIKNARKLGVRA
jgi:hypothetical protein